MKFKYLLILFIILVFQFQNLYCKYDFIRFSKDTSLTNNRDCPCLYNLQSAIERHDTSFFSIMYKEFNLKNFQDKKVKELFDTLSKQFGFVDKRIGADVLWNDQLANDTDYVQIKGVEFYMYYNNDTIIGVSICLDKREVFKSAGEKEDFKKILDEKDYCAIMWKEDIQRNINGLQQIMDMSNQNPSVKKERDFYINIQKKVNAITERKEKEKKRK